jgi:protein TonB
VLEYPLASRRLREQGRVEVRLLVDAMGLPQQAQVVRTSGYQRLDEAALATVRATRFKPYTENGVPQSFWVVMPLVFELEN